MKATNYSYSPFEISEYTISALPDCLARTVLALPEMQCRAAWNLLWLSLPALDTLIEHGTSQFWAKHFTMPDGEQIKALIGDAIGDEYLFRKLQMHPQRFLDWFLHEDHSIYDSYDALPGWEEIVMQRAKLSVLHHDALDETAHRNVVAFRPRVVA